MTAAALTPGQAFLRAICEEPARDDARLIYADWLEEHGEGDRAEFIRVQVKLAAMPPCDNVYCVDGRCSADDGRGPDAAPDEWDCLCGRAALRRRERELWCEHWFGLTDGLLPYPRKGHPPGPRGGTPGVSFFPGDDRELVFTFRRGFVAAVTLPADAFLRHAAAIFACQPVTEVRLGDREPANWREGAAIGAPRDCHAWQWHEADGRDYPWRLPRPLVEGLAALQPRRPVYRDDDGLTVNVYYPSAGEAWAALVALGRAAAGMPPLP